MLCFAGLTVVNPNEATVVTLFGVYKGTIKHRGFWWVNPLTTRRQLSLRDPQLRERQAEGERARRQPHRDRRRRRLAHRRDVRGRLQRRRLRALRARAERGGACGIWRPPIPTMRTRMRKMSLRLSAGGEVADRLRHEIQERLAKAGIEVIEARISHLAYAPEIAGAMLRRQQASAIIAARQKIVEGAVGMVEMALDETEPQERRGARRRAQGGDGEQSARRAVQRTRRGARREHGNAVSIGGTWPERKAFPAAARPGGPRRAAALGRRRAAQRQRTDRVPVEAGSATGGTGCPEPSPPGAKAMTAKATAESETRVAPDWAYRPS